jgi:signal transduction histidine kinase
MADQHDAGSEAVSLPESVSFDPDEVGECRVLIVDDDALVLEGLHALVARAGLECTTALTAQEVLRIQEADPHSIVIVDRMMPEMDGLDLTKALRARANSPYVYIIMLTVLDTAEDMLAGFAAGVDDYIAKTTSESELLARLHAGRMRVTSENRLRASEARYRELVSTLEQRVAARTATLQALVDDLEAISYNVSHQFRAPLRHISAAAHMLADSPEYATNQVLLSRAERIIGASHELAAMIDDLLAYTSLRDAPMHWQRTSMRELVEEVRSQLPRPAPGVSQHWIVEDLPDVWGDARMLRRLWQQLLSNAAKFSSNQPNAEILVRALSSDTHLTFQVSDNGVGFDSQYSSKLFGPFERLHAQKAFPGHGMGLAIARRLIERHGGAIWAESMPGCGATFYFQLPSHGERR